MEGRTPLCSEYLMLQEGNICLHTLVPVAPAFIRRLPPRRAVAPRAVVFPPVVGTSFPGWSAPLHATGALQAIATTVSLLSAVYWPSLQGTSSSQEAILVVRACKWPWVARAPTTANRSFLHLFGGLNHSCLDVPVHSQALMLAFLACCLASGELQVKGCWESL